MNDEVTYGSLSSLRHRLRGLTQSIDSYGTRVECALIATLALALVVVHVPLGSHPDSVGWYVANRAERLTIDLIDAPSPEREDQGAPITRIEQNVPDDPEDDGEEELERDDAGPLPDVPDVEKTLKRLTGRKVLDFAERMPEIVGGLGSYYIHITYPEAAVQAGIEGRLVLSFIVDTAGQTEDIEVVESLHPACDSAAVQALRITRFVPGRQNGRTVPVRMRLPVRFKLLRPDTTSASASVDL